MTENLTDETTEEGVISNETPDNPVESDPVDDAETFPRAYVEKLRDENAKYRQRAGDRDEIATKLHTALVAATGRLADPTDLTFDDDHIVDPNKMIEAINALLAAKPHLANRKPAGDIGQGVSGASDMFSLMGALRTNAN